MIHGYGRKARRTLATCRFTDEVTDLLARKIGKMPEYADCEIKSMGPFGLGATCSVSVKRGEDLLGFLTVGYNERDGIPFNYVDYDAPKRNVYPEDSIGDLNGFNYVTHPLPMDITEVLALVFHNAASLDEAETLTSTTVPGAASTNPWRIEK